ncbi:hypothetical protein [Mucisphaera calidilacus]|uniref:PEP-CTERM protein-sorting domain-containing protein n=1 Tax=Mucisphaera calidilacus TaxID=2527982 RepID=A0A518BW27_9BACT|nr:hypothetical protein [Mucisphaera calidilacus]QDU71185.1 hypothetical protein Pan265_10340 [Mucisphaera calidilacus]
MKNLALATALSLTVAAASNAAFLIEVDTDGLDNGVLVPSPNFAFGGDTTVASQSVAGTAVGLTGGDSIFGGNGATLPDTYLYNYSPASDADNLVLAPGTPLNDAGSAATGLVGGASGTYTFYATWPFSGNISGGLVTYEIVDLTNNVVLADIDVEQNNTGDQWSKLAAVELVAGNDYVVRQTSGANTFVSMRASAVMVEIPEPASAALLALGGLALVRRTA